MQYNNHHCFNVVSHLFKMNIWNSYLKTKLYQRKKVIQRPVK